MHCELYWSNLIWIAAYMKTSITPVTPNTYLIELVTFNLYDLGFIKVVCDLYKTMVSKSQISKWLFYHDMAI